jgi:hypothetical protein
MIQVGLQQYKRPWIEYGYYLRHVRDDVYGEAVKTPFVIATVSVWYCLGK